MPESTCWPVSAHHVKAHIVSDRADYPWSSHRAYLGREVLPWLTTDFALSLFSKDLLQARTAYQRFISEPGDDDDLDIECRSKDSRILGTDRFVESLPFIPYTPRSSLTLAQLAELVCQRHGVCCSTLRSRSRARSLSAVRIDFAIQAVDRRIGTLADVARFLGRDPSALTRLLSRHAKNTSSKA